MMNTRNLSAFVLGLAVALGGLSQAMAQDVVTSSVTPPAVTSTATVVPSQAAPVAPAAVVESAQPAAAPAAAITPPVHDVAKPAVDRHAERAAVRPRNAGTRLAEGKAAHKAGRSQHRQG